MAYDGESRNLYAQDIINPQTPESRLEALAADMFGTTGDDALDSPQSAVTRSAERTVRCSGRGAAR